MAVRLSMPPRLPIQGRTEAGVGLEKAILETTSIIRRVNAAVDNSHENKQKQFGNSRVTC